MPTSCSRRPAAAGPGAAGRGARPDPDEAAFAAATQARRWRCRRRLRLALHVQIDVAAETRAPGQGNRPAGRRDHQGRGQAGQRELRGPRAGRRGGTGACAGGRLHAGAGPPARPASAPGRRRPEVGSAPARLQDLVHAPGHGPGAAHARFARGAGHARRDLQVVDVVQRPARVQRAGLHAVEPGRGHAPRGQRMRPARFRRTGWTAPGSPAPGWACIRVR
jgi:hypothetical protein